MLIYKVHSINFTNLHILFKAEHRYPVNLALRDAKLKNFAAN